MTNLRGQLTANPFPAPASPPGGVDGRSNRRHWYRQRPQAGVDSQVMADAKPHSATCLAYADHLSSPFGLAQVLWRRRAIMSITVAVFRGTLDTASELFHVRTRSRKTSDAFRKE